MKRWSRLLLIGVLMLVFWTSACNYPAQTAAPSETAVPSEQFVIPTATATNTPLTPIIPITGENVVQMQCQFCVNSSAHAIFIFPAAAIFDVDTSSPVTCLTAEVVNSKRVLVCHGTQLTSFNLKICSDSSNCLLFPVALQPCPVAGAGTPITTATAITPVFLTPINTLKAPPRNPSATPMPTQPGGLPTPGTSTIVPSLLPTSSAIVPPPATSTPAPPPASTSTSAPPPPPPPPTQPASTPGPTSASTDGHKKPTKTPKP